MLKIYLCLLITFNNPIKSCFSNKKYPITIQTRQTKIVNSLFLIKPLVLSGYQKIIGVQNTFPTSFGTALVCKTL